MVETVLVFGLMMCIFEFAILCMIPVRSRLRILGNPALAMLMHFGMLLVNLIVHWGTVTGTMSATLAFIASLGVLKAATAVFGKMVGGRYYHVGLIKYSVQEVK